ncbi:dethiobiotin synthase [Flavobacteriales bacterium]|nr:dethiobiotin synthase [Flavobacteriales bacterium]
MRKVFVTGVGTDVGKTVVSAILTESWQADYWKPIQSGELGKSDTERVRRLISNTKTVFHPEAYRLTEPKSPHTSAELDGVKIRTSKLLKLPETENTLLIEGAGGLMVPYNFRGDTIIDIAVKMEAEIVLVVKHYLGSINHTLLSIEYLKSIGANILGIIFNGEPDSASEKVIINQSKVNVIGRVGHEYEFTRELIKEYSLDFVFV